MRASTATAKIQPGSPGGRLRLRPAWSRAAVMLAILAISAIACKAGEREPSSLRIGIAPWPGFDVLHHARKEGYFEKRGLTVEWMHFDVQQDAARAVVLGALDAAFVSLWDVIQLDRANDSPAFILVTNVSRGADGIVARPGIASMSELRGKRVAAKVGAVNHLTLLEALALHRMTPGDIELVDVNTEVAARRVADGSVDAAAAWEPAMSRIASQIGGSLVFTTRDVDSLVVDGLISSRKATREKREALIRLLMVWFDVMHDLETRPEQVYASAGAAIGVDAETFAQSYAGIQRGDRDLNREMFLDGRLLRAIAAQAEVIRTHVRSSTVRSDLVYPSDLLTAALERWRPTAAPGARASE